MNTVDNGLYEDMEDGTVELIVEWLNDLLPGLDLPFDASVEELRECLIDGVVLCSILNKLYHGSIQMSRDSRPGPAYVEKFLQAMDEMELPRFGHADMEQGCMVPVLQCLRMLKNHFHDDSITDHTQHGASAHALYANALPGHNSSKVSPKQRCYVDLSDVSMLELIKSNSLDHASTRTLFNLINGILDESAERKNCSVTNSAYVLKKVVQAIELRVSNQAENLKNQNSFYKVCMEKYQSRIRVLETIAAGTIEELEVLLSRLQHMKTQKTKIEEKEWLEEQDLLRLKEEKNHGDLEKLTLKHEFEVARKEHEEHCMMLTKQAEETKVGLEKKLNELDGFLSESRKKVNELESFSESKYQRWKKKEATYQSVINYQSGALQELRTASESIKQEVFMTKKRYSEEFKSFGMKLKGLVDAAENYQAVLAENRRLYNEIQDLKGNIRVYCRVRPFLSGQNRKQTTIEYIGENGELVVSNPSKLGKDSRKLFKFNKVFGPTANQEEVFLDIQPLIRSILDGYNVCIFAYGQTGSGKTYTMSGPTASSEADWGVNYRALHDLFQLAENRKPSITYEVGVQMVEIYNEQVRDLLSHNGSQRKLSIWNTTQPNGLAVPDASMRPVTSMEDVLELMDIGLMNRSVGATALNERSSRSHSVLTIHVLGTNLESGAVSRGCLHLIDLAGSERVDRSEATGDRLREAQNINKSLSALGDVIFSLSQKGAHVPYRNSKLTQVLQSSLGGQAKTLMFVQLNPDVDSYSETISTLKFAERVSGVELGTARTNKEGIDIKEIVEQVASLKDTIAKRDEEIRRLQLLKVNVDTVNRGRTLRSYSSSSPRRQSICTPRRSPSLSRWNGMGIFNKVAFDVDNNSSSNSEKHSETGCARSTDEFKYNNGPFHHSKSMTDLRFQKELPPLERPDEIAVGQNSKERTDLLGFSDADANEKLSEISDGGLSMGTETDGSPGSAAEFTLFPESANRVENMKPSGSSNLPGASKTAGKAENPEKPGFASKIPKPSPKLGQTQASRLSSAKSTNSKVPSSMSRPRKMTTSSSSAARLSTKRH